MDYESAYKDLTSVLKKQSGGSFDVLNDLITTLEEKEDSEDYEEKKKCSDKEQAELEKQARRKQEFEDEQKISDAFSKAVGKYFN